MNEVTLQDAGARLGSLIARAARTGESVRITRDGCAAGVLVSVETYAELQELRRDRDRRLLAEQAAADARGEIAWIRYPARDRSELARGLNEALDL
ncbi:type II toxin-antitoxin system Phd/YefM family antitoxin [Streptomonospora litoralis]|uniref:Antitoxin n=1 Tax=Streptomonospora litoralis TaxID=2498135 RepID=A0A4P6Q2Z4_9ACTN|nr:type II toxin-antitoxin system Phd/YefM family antitoxin [Streptomonospora litoralis]QBI53174.1 hypothetical protein EKD16_06885 [Streptomonospora litoralis]